MARQPEAGAFAESDRARLHRRLLAVTAGDLTSGEVDRLVDGDFGLLGDLPATAQRGVLALVRPDAEERGRLERMVGGSLDFVPVAYLDLARMAANGVARVADERRQPVGTGTMVSPRLFLTNNHVTPTPAEANGQVLQFDYELQVDGVPRPVVEFRLDPAAFFWTSDKSELDATLVAVGPRVSGSKALAEFGMSSMTAAGDKHAEGDFVTIVQHPEGNFKQVALRENQVVGRGKQGRTLHYRGDTLRGSSGSPVYNDQFELVALHHAGGAVNETELEGDRPVPDDSNEGIRVSAIVEALRAELDTVPQPHRSLLAEALDPSSTGPRMATVPAAPVAPAFAGAGSAVAEVTLPVRVQVGGQPAPAAQPAGAALTVAGIERTQPPDPDYGRRRGYDEDFLPVGVKLPGLSRDQLAAAAVPEGARRTEAGVVLDYLHFSVVVNAERRLPFFTAVNIDGKRARGINRQTGEVEAAETWYADPRIGEGEQLDQRVFASQSPRIFDRGHLVRRLDPAWGSAETAVRAAADTFHFTNCAPQVSAFNQRVALWAGIENYVLDNAKAERQRITVFSGPVFADDDPVYRDVPVPKEFWKVLVRVDGGELRCRAFLASQAELLAEAGVEAFDDLGRVRQFQVAVTVLGERTGLDFGPYEPFDTLATESVSAMEPIEAFADVQL